MKKATDLERELNRRAVAEFLRNQKPEQKPRKVIKVAVRDE